MEIIFILILLAVTLITEYFLYSRFGAVQLYYKAELEKNEVFENEEIILTEEITNAKRLPLPFVKTEIVAPAFIDFGVKTEVNKEGLCGIPSVFSLKGREKCRRVRKIRCFRRGMFEMGASTLYGCDLFGIGGFALNAAEGGVKLTVLPTPLEAEDFFPDNRQFFGEITVRRFICEDPFLVKGAREYTGREPMNAISWTATARAGKLMALNKDFTTAAKILILLNFQRMDDFFIPASDEVCELMIKAAAFAMERAEEIGAEFALEMNVTEDRLSYFGSGPDFKLEQLRRLAAVNADCRLKTEDFLRERKHSGFTDIIFITPSLSSDSVDYIAGLRERGFGVMAYSLRNEAESEFCSRIVRRVERKDLQIKIKG